MGYLFCNLNAPFLASSEEDFSAFNIQRVTKIAKFRFLFLADGCVYRIVAAISSA